MGFRLMLGIQRQAHRADAAVHACAQRALGRVGQVADAGVQQRESGEYRPVLAYVLPHGELCPLDVVRTQIDEFGRRRHIGRKAEHIAVLDLVPEYAGVDLRCLGWREFEADFCVVHLLGLQLLPACAQRRNIECQGGRFQPGVVDAARCVGKYGQLIGHERHARMRRPFGIELVGMVEAHACRWQQAPAPAQINLLAQGNIGRHEPERGRVECGVPGWRRAVEMHLARYLVVVQPGSDGAALPRRELLAPAHASHFESADRVAVGCGLVQPAALALRAEYLECALPVAVLVRHLGREGAALRVELLRPGRGRKTVVARVARLVVYCQKAGAKRPVLVQLQADAAHRVVEPATGVGAVPSGLGVALRQHPVELAVLAHQIDLLGKRVERACRDARVAMHTLFAGAPGLQVDRGEVVAADVWLRAFVHGDGSHAVDGQQIEQRVVPHAHVEGHAVDIGLDFAARAAGAHAADEYAAAIAAAKSAHGVEARGLHARCAAQGRCQVKGVLVAQLVFGGDGRYAREGVHAHLFNHGLGIYHHGGQGRCGYAGRLGLRMGILCMGGAQAQAAKGQQAGLGNACQAGVHGVSLQG